MYKVLITDDESMVREGLKKIIPWEEYGLEIIGEAKNGKEALEMIIEKRPHVLITDIKMPFMDGIELIREIKNRKLNVRIIVLSGYDEFDFVKNAMRYGAENYLLKPVSTEEMALAVNELADDLDKSLESEVMQREGLMFFRNSILNRLLKNEIGIREFKEKDEILKLGLSDTEMRIAVLDPYLDQNDPSEEESPADALLFAIQNICGEIIDARDHCIIFRDAQDHIVFIFKGLRHDCGSLQGLLQSCIQNINQYLSLNVVVSLGDMVSALRNVHLSYENALRGLDYRIVCGINRVIVFEETERKLKKCESEIHIQFDLIKNQISAADKEGLIAYIELLFLEIGNKIDELSPEFLRNFSGRIIISIFNELRVNRYAADRALELYDYTIIDRINGADELRMLKELVISVACKAIGLISDRKEKKYSRLVNQIVEYVDENYMDQNISLKTLEDKMKISAVHIGRTFKADTGEHFTHYLNKVRVEKAREMLLETDAKIKEIPEKVGFNNVAYFYNIFKKYTGLNPGDLRHV